MNMITMYNRRQCGVATMLVTVFILGAAASVATAQQELGITSSIKLGRPLFGDILGPLPAGDELTLVCSIEGSLGRTLSWWEGEEQLEASTEESWGLTSSSLFLGPTRPIHSGRRLACRDNGSELEKLVVLEVQDPASLDDSASHGTVHLNKEGEPVQDAMVIVEIQETEEQQNYIEVIQKIEGESLSINCILQGYSPSPLSWWEGKTQMQAQVTKSPYATSSTITFDALSADDNGRTFMCRAEGSARGSTVRLDIFTAELDITSNIQLGRPIFGDNIGPFQVGDDLTLTCSIQAPSTDALSWLEGDTELVAVPEQSQDFVSSSLVLGPLKYADSGRKFVCLEKKTGLQKLAVVEVEERPGSNTDGGQQELTLFDTEQILAREEKRVTTDSVEANSTMEVQTAPYLALGWQACSGIRCGVANFDALYHESCSSAQC